MTVRQAELLMAIVLALLSIGFMVKSAELNIGWVRGSGPGSGAWPFWLGVGMLLASIWTIVRWVRGTTPESQSNEVYISSNAMKIILPTFLALVGLNIASHIVGMYFAIMLFLIFYVRVMGRHSWGLTLALAIATPAVMFVFFDWALKSPLPKGYSEPLFYPLYNLIY